MSRGTRASDKSPRPGPPTADDAGARPRRGMFARKGADAAFRRSVLKWFGIFFLGSLVVTASGLYAVKNQEESRRLYELKAEEQGIVFAQLGAIRERLALVRSDLMFLRAEYEYLLNTPGQTPENIDRITQTELKNFSRSRGIYDQIRIIRPSGMEGIRVNYNGGSPISVAPDRLQDKSDRPYFSEAMKLPYDDVYVSPLDLNVEDGVVSRPFKPTIRISTPIETAGGERVGILILNYLATSMLTAVESAADLSTGAAMMLNSDGFWLVSRTPPPTWGFMFPDESDERMPVLMPLTWKAIEAGGSRQILTSEGLFSYSVVDPVSDIMTGVRDFEGFVPPRAAAGRTDSQQRWYVGTFVDAPTLDEAIGEPSGAVLFYGGLVVALCFLGSTGAAFALAEAKHYRSMLERLALFDSLTGLANRRSLEERLDIEIARARDGDARIVLAFLDIDGFKAINDELGHNVGDEALVEIAQSIEANIRAYDPYGPRRGKDAGAAAPLAARMGGDEFVVLFPDARDRQATERMLRRLGTAIRELSWQGKRVGVSIGVAAYPDHGLTRDALLGRADEAMYRAKSSRCTTFVVAGEDPAPEA
ncbi:diguanylate cyclase (GGDEF)-like protein [Amorphus suaedae]